MQLGKFRRQNVKNAAFYTFFSAWNHTWQKPTWGNTDPEA
jgi:hypothetical protein